MYRSLAPLNVRCQAQLNPQGLMLLYANGMTIASRIVQLRLAHKPKKLSQDAFGELCGVSKSAVSQWESGATEPDIKTLIKLRSKLAFSLDWLLTGEGDMGSVYKTDPVISHVVEAMQHMEKEDAAKFAEISKTFTKSRNSKRFEVDGITSMEFEREQKEETKRDKK